MARRAANFLLDPQGVLETDTRVGASVFTENNAKRLFGPRVALAWDPFSNTRTAIRAGFGTYYSLMDALSFQLNGLPPYNGAATFANVPLFSIVPVNPSAPLPRFCDVNVPQPCTNFQPRGVQADAKTPTVQEWNVTAEQQLDSPTSVHVAYVGSRGYHHLISIDPNSVPASVCATPGGCTAGGIGTARANVAQGAQYVPVVSGRPNPFLGAGFFWFAQGNTSYQALQIDVNRRLTAGFQVRGNYTWSKNLDMNSALTVAQANNQPQLVLDRNNLGRDWGPSALNATHQSSISGQYELPFGNGKRWLNGATGLTQKLASGWQLNGISTLLSGFPFYANAGPESFRWWQYAQPRPAQREPFFYRSSGAGHAHPVVRPERVCASFGRNLREPEPGCFPRTRTVGIGCLRVQKHRNVGTGFAAIPRGDLQRVEPGQLRHAECGGV